MSLTKITWEEFDTFEKLNHQKDMIFEHMKGNTILLESLE